MAARRVLIVGFPGVHSVDVSGPYEIFAAAGSYRVEIAAPQSGRFVAHSGLQMHADAALGDVRGPVDTLIVAGGEGTFKVSSDPTFLADVARLAKKARRVGSICTGAFVLAAAGLLDGHQVTTHWRHSERLRVLYPSVVVDADLIYVRSGDVYTSAGVTAGMDLALALVEDDCGHQTAMAIAREFVLYMRRSGGQSQFSTTLAAQTTPSEPLRALQSWILDNLAADLSVDSLAQRAHMSSRHFARVFAATIGQTPARYVERLRVDAAQRRLEETTASLTDIATSSGFGSVDSMRRSFLRTCGIAPLAHRRHFGDC